MRFARKAFLLQVAVASLFGATGVVAVESDGAGQFRVATFNIRCPIDPPPNAWTCRVGRVSSLIEKHQFDLVGFQEATFRQIDDLLATGWDSVGVGRSDGKREGETSCIFYRTARFELQDGATFWLSETPDIPGSKSWETACPRLCTWARFKDRRTGHEFVYFNTHLDHRSALAREKGIALILKKAGEIARGRPVILTGDFNATPGSEVVRVVTAELHDAAALALTPHAGPLATFNGFHVDQPPTAQIDYIFVSNEWRVFSHTTVDELVDNHFPSDHFPVVADVMIDNR